MMIPKWGTHGRRPHSLATWKALGALGRLRESLGGPYLWVRLLWGPLQDSRKRTWNLTTGPLQTTVLCQGPLFRLHVSLGGVKHRLQCRKPRASFCLGGGV